MKNSFYGYMVSDVPCQAIKLVNYEIIYRFILFDPREHFLKLWAVSGTGRFPAIRIFINKIPTLVFDEFKACFSLGRYRIPAFSLFFG